jgi:hypothetical protein
MPAWLEPMAATLTEERFSGPEWLFWRKFDGIRLLADGSGLENLIGRFSEVANFPLNSARRARSRSMRVSRPVVS